MQRGEERSSAVHAEKRTGGRQEQKRAVKRGRTVTRGVKKGGEQDEGEESGGEGLIEQKRGWKRRQARRREEERRVEERYEERRREDRRRKVDERLKASEKGRGGIQAGSGWALLSCVELRRGVE